MKILLFLGLVSVIVMDSTRSYTMLMMYSYDDKDDNNVDCGRGILEGLVMNSIVEGLNFQLFRYFMDSRGKSQAVIHQSAKTQFDLMTEKVVTDLNGTFDMLILMDDDAIDYYIDYVNHTFYNQSKVVYTGMNGNPFRGYQPGSANLTAELFGVFEPVYLAESVSLCNTIVDLNDKILVAWFDDFTSGHYKYYTIDYEEEWSNCYDIYGEILRAREVKQIGSPAQLEAEIIRIKDNTSIGMIYFGIQSLTDDVGNILSGQAVVNLFLTLSAKYNLRIPEFASSRKQTEHGLLGGPAVDFENMGERGGFIIAKLLNGRNPAVWDQKYGGFNNFETPYSKLFWNQPRIETLVARGAIPGFPETLKANAAEVFLAPPIIIPPEKAVNVDKRKFVDYIPLIVTILILLCFGCCATCAIGCVVIYVIVKYFRDKSREITAQKKVKVGTSFADPSINNDLGEPLNDLSRDDEEFGGYSRELDDDDDGFDRSDDENDDDDGMGDEDIGDISEDDDNNEGSGVVGDISDGDDGVDDIQDVDDDGDGGGGEEGNVGDLDFDDSDGGDQYFRVD